MGRMTNRDRRDQSFERVALGHVAGHSDGEDRAHFYTDRPYIQDAREMTAAAPAWIIMAQFDGCSNFFRERNGRGYNVWTLDARAAEVVRSFDSEDEAGIYIARMFSETEINQFAIQPTAVQR